MTKKLRRYLGAIAALYTLAILLLGFAAGRASAHDAYHDWLMPNGGRCCSDLERECRPVRSDFDADRGVFVILVDGRWRDVPPAAVIAKPSPDGNSHACIGSAGTIFHAYPFDTHSIYPYIQGVGRLWPRKGSHVVASL